MAQKVVGCHWAKTFPVPCAHFQACLVVYAIQFLPSITVAEWLDLCLFCPIIYYTLA